ncbi:MAG: glutamine-hydrolyzing carbamoyl-phosphate synthase small subunit [Polynucleobacter sp.]|nr:glutamine-hydrolyzing carbamoyl-phosphate synthase small subunit [Polynucleobacter sp.]
MNTSSNSLLSPLPPAVLVLADGATFLGRGIGVHGSTSGEVVFNTALTGYQEILTDPSYTQQIVTLTYPHIGNVGVNLQDCESKKVYAAGLVIRDLSPIVSNFRATESLAEYLTAQGIVGIAQIDTRALTRHLRDHGAQPGAIVAGKRGDSVQALLVSAKTVVAAFPGMTGLDLAQVVSCTSAYDWHEGEWQLLRPDGQPGFDLPAKNKKVVAYDFGIKRNILRMLAQRGCTVTVVPAKTSASEVLAMQPDGIFLSNGPGDPQPCDYAIAAVQTFLERKIPLFGICLGHQIMGLAAGAKTLKMKFGHHGANHPVKDLETGRVVITSQNHGFAVDAKTLPANVLATHISLFDGSLQGLAWTDRPAFCFQGHPEASPGPQDVAYLFDRFIQLM